MSENALSYLRFEDWIAHEEHKCDDWIVVARHIPDSWPRPFTVSVLLPDEEEYLEKLFCSASCGFGPEDLGRPGYNMEGDEPVYYSDSAGIGYLPFKALTLYRSFPFGYPTPFDLLQEFVMYHNGHYDQEGGNWVAVDEAGQDVVIAKRYSEDDGEHGIKASARTLRGFLTTGPWLLVRCHDHGRKTERTSLPDGEDFVEEHIKDDDRFYEIWLRNDLDEDETHSTLLGFDIVRPYHEVPRERRWWDPDRRQFEEFIIGVDDSGEPKTYTCDERRLTSLFLGSGGIPGLTAVYFKPEVLEKYRSDAERYGGEPGVAGLWSLDYEINDEGLVQVWLKDLGRIPYSEQEHWKACNIPPAGGVPQERIARDFLLKPMPPRSPARRFWESYEGLSQIACKKLGFDLFRPLRDDDRHCIAKIAWPIANRLSALDEQLVCLSKVLGDSINVAGISDVTGLRTDNETIRGSIDLLEAALNTWECPEDEVKAVVSPIRLLQQLRSSGGAHRRGDNFDRVLRKAGLEKLPWHAIQGELLERLTESLAQLVKFLTESEDLTLSEE